MADEPAFDFRRGTVIGTGFDFRTGQVIGGGSSGGGGVSDPSRRESSSVDLARMEAQRQAELEMQRQAKAQKVFQEQRAQQLADQKRFREMNARQRRAFQQSQRDLSTAKNVQRLIQRGGTPTPQALKTFRKVTKVTPTPTIQERQARNFSTLVKNKQVKLPKRKETIPQKINRIGALTNKRKQRLIQNNLNKERDNIYNDLNKVLNKHKIPGTNEINTFSPGYQNDLAKVVARYNQYEGDRNKFASTIKGGVKAGQEFDININEDVLVAQLPDRGLDVAIQNLTTKVSRKKKTSSDDVKLASLVGVKLAKDLVGGIVHLPKTVVDVVKNPSTIKQLPSAIKKSGVATGRLLKISSTAGLVKLGGEVYFWTKAPGHAVKIVKKIRVQASRLNPLFRGVRTTPLGVKAIKKVNKVGDIEIILNRGQKLKTKPLKVIKQAEISKKLKEKPSLAPTTKVEKDILNVVKKRGDVVTGSFAREVLLKKKFSRKHKDLDIASRNIPALQTALKKKFGKRVTFNVKPNSVLVKINGKEIADLVPFKKAEAGLIKKFGTTTVKGIKFSDVRAIVGGKVTKLGQLRVPVSLTKSLRGQVSKKARRKVTKDIEKLAGKKALDRPALTGAFGFTKKEQAKLLGKEGALTTAQADLLTKGLLRRNPKLKLKRWLYATPWELKTGKAQVRVSRLGLKTEEATLMQLLRGQASLINKNKPQIFVMPKEKILKAPKGITKAKPIKTKGFVVPNFSSELEVVLGKGFIIKRGKKLGTTIISGERVPIVELKKVKLSKTIKSELKTYNKLQDNLRKISKKPKTKKLAKAQAIRKRNLVKKIDARERALNTKMKKLTGFDYFSKRVKPRKVFRPSKKLVSVGRVSKIRGGRKVSVRPERARLPRRRPLKRRPTKGRPSKPSRGVPSRPSPRRLVPRRPVRRVPGRPTGRPAPRPIKKTKPVGFPRRKKIKKSKKKKEVQVFNVFGRSRGKFVRLNKKPLTREDALSRGAFAVDNTTARTFKITSAGKTKKAGTLRKQERNYFNRSGFKLREQKIRKGRKFQLKNKFIEKRKFGIDTRGEKRGLTIAKFLRGKKRVKRKITPAQRKVMLSNLAKARRARGKK